MYTHEESYDRLSVRDALSGSCMTVPFWFSQTARTSTSSLRISCRPVSCSTRSILAGGRMHRRWCHRMTIDPSPVSYTLPNLKSKQTHHGHIR